MTMADWNPYAQEGDKWIIAYASVSGLYTVQAASVFIIGHAVELYLKAAHIKIYNDEERAIGFGHRLHDIWSECKSRNAKFMQAFDIRDSIFKQDFFDPKVVMQLSEADKINFDSHRNLYAILKELQNLKYWGVPWKPKRLAETSIVTQWPDMFWVRFFKDLRGFLGHPSADHADIIRIELEHNSPQLHEDSKRYLRGFIN